jgi:hypothetical protein
LGEEAGGALEGRPGGQEGALFLRHAAELKGGHGDRTEVVERRGDLEGTLEGLRRRGEIARAQLGDSEVLQVRPQGPTIAARAVKLDDLREERAGIGPVAPLEELVGDLGKPVGGC